MQCVLTARHLTKKFGDFVAVDNIDFEIHKGEIFGFLGPNGAGKSTTIKMIYGGFPPTSGDLNIFGLSVAEHRREIKKRMGVVTQQDILEESLSSIDNLRIQGRYHGFDTNTVALRSKELLQWLQLGDRQNDPVYKFSGGMKRRLSIAKGLLNKPEMLLLDEPTTGLDPQARHMLWDALKAIRALGTSVLLTTHYMHEAEELCDRLMIIDHGKIIEEGSPKELIIKHQCNNLEQVFIKLTGRELKDG